MAFEGGHPKEINELNKNKGKRGGMFCSWYRI